MNELQYVEALLLLDDSAAREKIFRQDSRLRRLLPEVYRLEEIPQPPEHHPEGDVLTHTLLAVGCLPAGADRRLAWAALLHDIGKAETTRVIDGRIRAFGHDRAGVEMADKLLCRLGMEEPIRENIKWLIGHHMFALSWQISDRRRLSRRQCRLIGDPRFPLLLELMEIDARASGSRPGKLEQVEFYRAARAALSEKRD